MVLAMGAFVLAICASVLRALVAPLGDNRAFLATTNERVPRPAATGPRAVPAAEDADSAAERIAAGSGRQARRPNSSAVTAVMVALRIFLPLRASVGTPDTSPVLLVDAGQLRDLISAQESNIWYLQPQVAIKLPERVYGSSAGVFSNLNSEFCQFRRPSQQAASKPQDKEGRTSEGTSIISVALSLWHCRGWA